ncbi:MAG: SAM-dependent chlorinase/fluorinase [Actinomycetes bacterium]
MGSSRPVTFLTDYGYADEFVGVCHALIAERSPQSRIFDVTHGIKRHDVRSGALVLRRSLPYFPAGIHLAVVDPQVGGERRGIAVRTADEDRIFVAPDNGLISLAAQRFGGIVEAVDISGTPQRLEPTAATFHGRDIFAPVAGHLAAGGHLSECGSPLDPDELVVLEMPLARAEGDQLITHALTIDAFGNVTLDVEHEELAAFGLRLGQLLSVNGNEAPYVTSYIDVPTGSLLVYEDAYRSLAVAVNRGSAAAVLGLAIDDEVQITPR